MASFVLIHGSWQGAWCWREILSRLATHGHEAVAPDLPGHGEDRTPPESVTFQDYVDCTLAAVHASQDAPILVGHSMGGAIIRQAAGLAPDRIRARVSIAAPLPAHGATMLSFVEGFDPDYLAQILWAPDGRTARLSREGVSQFLCSGCPAPVVESVLPLLTPEPVAPFETPLFFHDSKALNYYIECLQDRIVPIGLQRTMHADVPAERVYSLESGHAPFLSTPDELALVLQKIAAQS
jgi:pimeloyl-ACP methyl ester carboxylesterase